MASSQSTDTNAMGTAKAEQATHVLGCESVLTVAVALVEQGHQRLDVCSNHLLPEIYGTPVFAAAVQSLALRHPQVRIRLLVKDPVVIIKSGHRLHALSCRLPSRISLRQTDPASEAPECMLLMDDKAYLRYTDECDYRALCNRCDAVGCRTLRSNFQACWAQAIVPDDLRRLQL